MKVQKSCVLERAMEVTFMQSIPLDVIGVPYGRNSFLSTGSGSGSCKNQGVIVFG